MTTIVLNAETSGLSLGQLLQQASQGEIRIQDSSGKVVAVVMPPVERDELTRLIEIFDRSWNDKKNSGAAERRGGITTAELLRRAEAAAKQATEP